MSALKGWCPTCRGPLWRPASGLTIRGCRLCWLDRVLLDTAGAAVWPWSGRERFNLRGDCNSTEDTAATSEWLPRAHMPRRIVHHPDEATALHRWLAIWGTSEFTRDASDRAAA